MATYQPPTEDLTDFNSSVFTTANEASLTLSQAKGLFLGRTGNPTSTATSTTFNGTLTTGTVNGVTLFTNATYGTKIGTGNSTSSLSSNCVLLGDNILMGGNASNTNQNVLVGSNISNSGQDLKQCVAVGTAIMKTAQNQVNNVCVGHFSCNGGGGSDTTAVGANSARNSTGGQNVAVGSNSLLANTSGTGNVAVGYEAFKTGATFTNSTAIGAGTVIGASTSTAIGYGATTSVANSIVLGTATEFVSCPGTSATNGSLTTAADIYVNTLRAGVGKFQTDTNTCFGKDSLITTNSLGLNNTACGNSALKLQLSGANCSAFGSGALATTTAEGNTAVGAIAGNIISTGTKNTAIGSACLKFLTTGSQNTALGNGAGQVLAGGSNNTFVGYIAGTSISGGSSNAFVGSTVSSGGTVSSSSALGAFSGVAGFSNSTAIGGGTSAAVPGAICSANNQIMLGRSTETVECPGTVSSISLNAARNISINGKVFGIGAGGSDSLFCGLSTGAGQGAGMTIFGSGSYAQSGDGSSNRNTIIGALSMTSTTTSYNDATVIGYGCNNSGSGAVEKITLLGATTSAAAGQSTAIGYGATATLANQIILGRSTEFVECSGTNTTNGCLKLNGGLKLQTSYGAVPSATMLGYRIVLSAIDITALTSNTSITIGSLDLTVGVWSLNYTFELLSTGATSTTQQAFFFSDQSGSAAAYSTRIDNTGTTRFHSTMAYTNNDRPAYSGGGTYYASSAITLYPALNITFSTGTLTGTGYASATRIG